MYAAALIALAPLALLRAKKRGAGASRRTKPLLLTSLFFLSAALGVIFSAILFADGADRRPFPPRANAKNAPSIAQYNREMKYFYAKVAHEFDLLQKAPQSSSVIAKNHNDVSRRLKRRAISDARCSLHSELYIRIQNARAYNNQLRRAYMENRPDETEKLRKEIKSELGRFLILSQRIERGTQS